jgi:uncharacterized protein (DUF2062 family)
VISSSIPTEAPAVEATSFFQRRLITPIVNLLRMGATPEKLAWSLAIGFVVGVNPLLGSTTLVCMVVALLARLNMVASQIANHLAYPLEIALFFVFVRIGDVFFHTGHLPIDGHTLYRAIRQHPIATTRVLWAWEWHALVVWLLFAAIVAPILATLFTPMLHRLHHRIRKEHPTA